MCSPRAVPVVPWLVAAALAWSIGGPSAAHATCSSPAQAVLDTDGDGLCDLDDPNDAQLNVLKVKLKRSFRLGSPETNGLIVVRGDFNTDPPADTFSAADGISVHVVDSYVPPDGPLDVLSTWTATECTSNAKGHIRCKSADGARFAYFKPLGHAPSVWRLGVRLKRLDIDAPFLHPVTVTVTNGVVTDRVDVATECRATVTGLVCKKL